MTELFVRLETGWLDHPALIALGLEARGAHAVALALAKRLETDGWIARALLAREGITDDLIDRMVAVDLLELDTTTDRIRPSGWLDRNPSQKAIDARRRARRTGGAIGNHRRWHHPGPFGDCPICHPHLDDPNHAKPQVVARTDRGAIAKGSPPDRPPIATTSQPDRTDPTDDHNGPDTALPNAGDTADVDHDDTLKGHPDDAKPQVVARTDRLAIGERSGSDPSPIATRSPETETETETTTYPTSTTTQARDRAAPANGAATVDSDEQALRRTAALIGRHLAQDADDPAAYAASITRRILTGPDPDDRDRIATELAAGRTPQTIAAEWTPDPLGPHRPTTEPAPSPKPPTYFTGLEPVPDALPMTENADRARAIRAELRSTRPTGAYCEPR